MSMPDVRQPSFNVDKLEGAVKHMLMVCGALSDAALDDFVKRYAYMKGKRLPSDYASKVLLPRMVKSKGVFRTTQHLYSLHPLRKSDPNGLNAFWVFLEHMEGAQIESVINGPYPARLSYIKNNRVYRIVCCEDNGATEIGMTVQLEIEASQRYRKNKNEKIEERFFFVFSSEENMKRAPFSLKTPSLFCSVVYPHGQQIPDLNFVNPVDLGHV